MATGGMKLLTVPVPDTGLVVVRCPACSRKHTLSVARFKGKKEIIKVRCHCAELFALELEFRKSVTTGASYTGNFENCSQGHVCGQIQITAMTNQGMDFTTCGRSTINKGDKLKINFHDPEAGFKVKKKNVIVSAVHGTRISCYFV
ncbi:MAG: hypothetical protein KKD73_05760 [Proteobacteria bacterium]|nr:hypothetical protein [Pseudomonadota bacterium]MBU1639850.1 hypothetical protein [Pseudomonadota bacterium]